MQAGLGWRRQAFFSAILAALALLSVEVPLQLYYRFSAGDWLFRRALPQIYAVDPLRCYRVKPDLDFLARTNEFEFHLYTNAQSFRTDARRAPTPFEKADDVYRVLFLGPSFTLGWGSEHEETYAARIASALRVPGRRVELLNLGTPGQAIEPQLCWLAREGWRYQPDLVVQTSYGDRPASMPSACPQELACPFIADSRLYTREPSFEQRAIAAVKNLATVFYGFYVYTTFAGGDGKPGVGTGKELYPAEPSAEDPPQALAQGYRAFIAFVREWVGAGTPVAFVHIPLAPLVHEGDRARWRHVLEVDAAQAQARTRADIAALRAAGLKVIDTLDPLIRNGESERQFFWLDIHLTPAGNATVAETALPELQALVEASPPVSPARASR